jgi:hypothetical protein
MCDVGKCRRSGKDVINGAAFGRGCVARATRMRHAQALSQEQLELAAKPLPPMTEVGALVRELCWKNSSPGIARQKGKLPSGQITGPEKTLLPTGNRSLVTSWESFINPPIVRHFAVGSNGSATFFLVSDRRVPPNMCPS